jgi:hypothetical protein
MPQSYKDYKTNIKYGCYYLRVLIDYYKGDKTLAICAYNAGMGTVDKWLNNDKNFKTEADNIKVPYKETERYLKKIIKGKQTYIKESNKTINKLAYNYYYKYLFVIENEGLNLEVSLNNKYYTNAYLDYPYDMNVSFYLKKIE